MVTKNICMTSSSYFFFLTEHATIFLYKKRETLYRNCWSCCVEFVEVTENKGNQRESSNVHVIFNNILFKIKSVLTLSLNDLKFYIIEFGGS